MVPRSLLPSRRGGGCWQAHLVILESADPLTLGRLGALPRGRLGLVEHTVGAGLLLAHLLVYLLVPGGQGVECQGHGGGS
jgi:hypothetical protein